MWFDSWYGVGRVCLAALLAYVALVMILRTSGKRTLAKLNAFDLVVTVALGSALATVALSSEVSLAEGVAALAVIILSQFVVAWTAVRSRTARKLAKSEPALLVSQGRLDHDLIKAQRVAIEEIHQAVRNSGAGGLELVAAVVLETDGTLSVIRHDQRGSGNVLPSG